MTRKIIVIGGKGTAVVVAEHVHDAGTRGAAVEFIGFAFDDPNFGNEINGFPILSSSRTVYERYGSMNDVSFIFQMYRTDLMRDRIGLRESLGIPREKYFTFIHPTATVMRSVSLGAGCVVMASTVIMPNVSLGDHCTVLAGCTIGHDTLMGSNNFLATHVVMGSGCTIGEANFFGMNSTINTRTAIGNDCFVGMASNVIHDLADGLRVKGNPARPYEGSIKPL